QLLPNVDNKGPMDPSSNKDNNYSRNRAKTHLKSSNNDSRDDNESAPSSTAAHPKKARRQQIPPPPPPPPPPPEEDETPPAPSNNERGARREKRTARRHGVDASAMSEQHKLRGDVRPVSTADTAKPSSSQAQPMASKHQDAKSERTRRGHTVAASAGLDVDRHAHPRTRTPTQMENLAEFAPPPSSAATATITTTTTTAATKVSKEKESETRNSSSFERHNRSYTTIQPENASTSFSSKSKTRKKEIKSAWESSMSENENENSEEKAEFEPVTSTPGENEEENGHNRNPDEDDRNGNDTRASNDYHEEKNQRQSNTDAQQHHVRPKERSKSLHTFARQDSHGKRSSNSNSNSNNTTKKKKRSLFGKLFGSSKEKKKKSDFVKKFVYVLCSEKHRIGPLTESAENSEDEQHHEREDEATAHSKTGHYSNGSNDTDNHSNSNGNDNNSNNNNNNYDNEDETISVKQFGVPIKMLAKIDIPYYDSPIPSVLVTLGTCIFENQGYLTDGIFRKQPNQTQFTRIKGLIDSGKMDSIEFQSVDPLIPAQLIKQWFRELPTPLLHSITIQAIEQTQNVEKFAKLFENIPEPNKSIFLWLLDLCAEIAANESSNQMNAQVISSFLKKIYISDYF
ncbi:hypothetical protein RFI_24883, partial [Reticulomyxa filosa]